MGFAIAEACVRAGARVTLIRGPVAMPTPPGAEAVFVETALEMREALARAMGDALERADALVMAAAVADFRPAHASASKVKKEAGAVAPELPLVANPDLLAEVGARRRGALPVLVGFALETADDEALVAYARNKLTAKSVDMVVANHAIEALGTDTNRVFFVEAESERHVGPASKRAIADEIALWVGEALAARATARVSP
jgi:phosphopantothenoylcysteine decarboxylase/phosphopantothenate--cysteine ligase